FAIVATPRLEGTGAGQLRYNWTEGTRLRLHTTAGVFAPKTEKIRIWVHGDNSGHSFCLLGRDQADNDLFRSPLLHINWTGWKEVVWDLANDPLSVFNVSGDGVMTSNIRIDSIYMEKVGSSNIGDIYLEDRKSVV